MSEYKTHQKAKLMEFLEKNENRQFTVAQICDEMEKQGVGKSTVYRLVDKMVTDGTLRRFVKDNSRKFLYQYTNKNECKHHLHLKCVGCGALIHLDAKTTQKMENDIFNANNFHIDQSKTLLFGQCENCSKE